MGVRHAVTNRLAACIYFADMELQNRPSVLWDMVPVGKQIIYVHAASRALTQVARKTTPVPRRQKIDRARGPA